jgi:hypothetical protein
LKEKASSDSDNKDDSGDSCNQEEGGKPEDELTPAEQEELQRNIINAIENFEKLYKPIKKIVKKVTPSSFQAK